MSYVKHFRLFLLTSCAALLFFSTPGYSKMPDWQNYQVFLTKHLTDGARKGVKLVTVDYISIRNDPEFWKIVDELEKFPVDQLKTQQDRMAFYINAYNILSIKVVVNNWPLKSIKDVGSFLSPVWKKEAGKINGKSVSLHEIEHEILRPLGDPRIHGAIVCASVSCPDLRKEPFVADKLDRQLDDQMKLFLGNTTKGVSVNGDRIMVSKIFDWFEEDFQSSGGVVKFIRKYRTDIPSNAKIDSNLKYHWVLNISRQNANVN